MSLLKLPQVGQLRATRKQVLYPRPNGSFFFFFLISLMFLRIMRINKQKNKTTINILGIYFGLLFLASGLFFAQVKKNVRRHEKCIAVILRPQVCSFTLLYFKL